MHVPAEAGLTRKQATVFFLFTAILAVAVLASKHVLPVGLVRLAAMGIVASVVGLLIFSYPKQGFYFAVFYVYAGLTYYAVFPLAYPIVVLVAAAVLFRLVRGEEVRLRDPLFLWSTALFTILAIQSMLVAYNHWHSLKAFGVYFKAFVMVFLATQLMRKPKDYENLAMIILAGVIATVLLGVINIKMGWVRDPAVLVGILGFNRFAGTHLNPNTGALYMVAALPLAVYAVRRIDRTAIRIAFVLAAIGLAAATIMTFSRQAIFPLLFVILAVLIKEARSKWAFSVVVVVALIAFLLTPAYYWHRILTVSDMIQGLSEDWSFFLRVQAHITAWNLFVDNPLTGVGLNNFVDRSGSELIVRIPTHNAYLDILVGVGIFGFAAYLAVLLSGVRGFIIAMRTRWDREHQWMSHLSYYFFISFLSTLFGAVFQSVAFYYLVWLPVAGGVIAGQLAREARQNAKISET